jgi:hypothetical protein
MPTEGPGGPQSAGRLLSPNVKNKKVYQHMMCP